MSKNKLTDSRIQTLSVLKDYIHLNHSKKGCRLLFGRNRRAILRRMKVIELQGYFEPSDVELFNKIYTKYLDNS